MDDSERNEINRPVCGPKTSTTHYNFDFIFPIKTHMKLVDA
jgi:hypothetical protein